jgi:hypothetical protein
MLRGSPYSYLVAVNGKSLSLADQERGRQKLEEVTKQRQSESPQQQEERIRKYQKDRERDHLTMEQLVDAFDFKLLGEQKMGGFDIYVLSAKPRPGYQPPNSDVNTMVTDPISKIVSPLSGLGSPFSRCPYAITLRPCGVIRPTTMPTLRCWTSIRLTSICRISASDGKADSETDWQIVEGATMATASASGGILRIIGHFLLLEKDAVNLALPNVGRSNKNVAERQPFLANSRSEPRSDVKAATMSLTEVFLPTALDSLVASQISRTNSSVHRIKYPYPPPDSSLSDAAASSML